MPVPERTPDHPHSRGAVLYAIVYPNNVAGASGVCGHDHILAAPPAPPSRGGDFNVIWEPIAVLFTDGNHFTHIKTLSELTAAKNAGYVRFVPLPAATFYCAVVAASPYYRGTPIPPAPNTP